MKAPDHERKHHLDGTEKPSIQILWNPRSRARQCGDLDDKCFYWIAFFHFPHVNGGVPITRSGKDNSNENYPRNGYMAL